MKRVNFQFDDRSLVDVETLRSQGVHVFKIKRNPMQTEIKSPGELLHECMLAEIVRDGGDASGDGWDTGSDEDKAKFERIATEFIAAVDKQKRGD